MLSPISYIPTLQSPFQGNNLPNVVNALKGQQNAYSPINTPSTSGSFSEGFGQFYKPGSNGPNMFAPGGMLSMSPSYINESGDLMSGGQVTPG